MVFLRQVGASVTAQTGDFPLRDFPPAKPEKRGPRAGPFSSTSKILDSDSAGPTADLTQKVGRQFDYWLLVVSFDAVVRQFKYLLHCSPREGLDKNEEPVLSA